MSHRFVSVDFETRSPLELGDTGVYTYAEDPETDVWCMAYTVGDDPAVHLWTRGQPFPDALQRAMQDGFYFRAWNAAFERVIWSRLCTPRYGWPAMPTDRWVCTMALGLAAGLPGKLETAAKALKLLERKDEAGHRLMLQMSKPRRVKGSLLRVWWDDPERLERLYAYCRQDVVVENALWAKLPPSMDGRERRIWLLDADMNDRGIRLDMPLVWSAHRMADAEVALLDARMADATGGVVPTTTKTNLLREWVGHQLGRKVASLDKQHLQEFLDEPQLLESVRLVLELRQEAAKASVAKLVSMENVAGGGDRARGVAQYYGAGTGRWAGRLIQLQNLPKGNLRPKEIPPLVQAILHGNVDCIRQAYDRPLDVLSSMLRSCLIPSAGTLFDVADFSAIEARVVAWLAGQEDVVALFASGGKVYERMASVIFNLAEAEITKESNERDIGKRTVLGCGFQMGADKFRATVLKQGGGDIGLELAERAVKAFRTLNPAIVGLWTAMNDTAIAVVEKGYTHWCPVPGTADRVAFSLHQDYLMLRLPAGRALWYCHPRIVSRRMPWSTPEHSIYRPAVQVMAVDSLTRQWLPADLYGGLFTENAVQAIARDLLADAMLRVHQPPHRQVVLTVHDEVVVESDPATSHDEFIALMSVTPEWAAGCPVAADGWRGDRYRK